MEKKRYVMVGTKTITKEIFKPVLRPLNNHTYIPLGGFWSCEYKDNFNISEWFYYMIDSGDSIDEKNIEEAVIFTLKDNARILVINDYEDLKKVISKYPSYHHLLNYYKDVTSKEESINFELLSKDYDGISINYHNLFNSNKTAVFTNWAVNTLLLFNLDVIDSYTKCNINYYLPGSYYYRNLIEEPNLYHIEEESIYHKEIFDYAKIVFDKIVSTKNTFNDYDEYFKHLINCSKETIEIIKNNKSDIANIIKENLEKENIYTTEEKVIINIVLGVLSNYLRDHVEIEKTLPKTQRTEKYKIKEYPIIEDSEIKQKSI